MDEDFLGDTRVDQKEALVQGIVRRRRAAVLAQRRQIPAEREEVASRHVHIRLPATRRVDVVEEPSHIIVGFLKFVVKVAERIGTSAVGIARFQ